MTLRTKAADPSTRKNNRRLHITQVTTAKVERHQDISADTENLPNIMEAIDNKADHAEILAENLLTRDKITAIYQVKNSKTDSLDEDVVQELVEENVVKQVNDGVELTEKGKLLYPIVKQLLEKSFLDQLNWLIDRTDDWEESLPPFHLLQDASVKIEQSPEYTREVVDRYNELVEETGTLQELSPFILGAGIESREAVLPTGTDCTYIFSESMVQDINDSERHREALQEYKEDSDVQLLQYPGEFPYMLTVLDEHTLLIGRGNDFLTVLIESNGENLQMWAEKKIQEYQEQATELQLDQSTSPPKIQ